MITSSIHNRRNPYRVVLNDFFFFEFIYKILKSKNRLSYNQFVITMYSKEGNVDEMLEILENNTFRDENDVEILLETNFQNLID